MSWSKVSGRYFSTHGRRSSFTVPSFEDAAAADEEVAIVAIGVRG